MIALRSRLDVVKEMLDSMDTLTLAGRRYAMSKVVAFFGESLREGSQLPADSLKSLAQEADRMVPDVETFNRRAAAVIVGYRHLPAL